MKKQIAIILLASSIAVLACSFLCSCTTTSPKDFGFPTFGELESITVQEYVNGQSVSREVSLDAEQWANQNPDDSAFGMWSGDAWAMERVDGEGKAETSQALKYRLVSTDDAELEFFVYFDAAEGAVYFQKTDGELWRGTSDSSKKIFRSEYEDYQRESFEQAFRAQVKNRNFKMLSEYNGTGKAFVVEDCSTLPGDSDNPNYKPSIEYEAVYWDGWDGSASLQLPHYQGRWGKDDYGAIRPEDVRFVLIYELIDEKIDGEWVTSRGDHVSYTYDYTFQGTAYDLLTGEKATFLDTSDSYIRDQAEKFIDDANANSKH